MQNVKKCLYEEVYINEYKRRKRKIKRKVIGEGVQKKKSEN